MSNEKVAKEFWISPFNKISSFSMAWEHPSNCPLREKEKLIHVIEFSAYEQIKHEFKMLQSGAERINKENQKLQARVQALREALTDLIAECEFENPSTTRAKEDLAQDSEEK